MGTRTNFYKNPSSAYNRDFDLSSALRNLKGNPFLSSLSPLDTMSCFLHCFCGIDRNFFTFPRLRTRADHVAASFFFSILLIAFVARARVLGSLGLLSSEPGVAYNIVTGSAPLTDGEPSSDEKAERRKRRRRGSEAPCGGRSRSRGAAVEDDRPMSHDEYVEKRRQLLDFLPRCLFKTRTL